MSGTMTVHFEGFWQCRLSTDPDPTREKRGTSGYTVALPREHDLDRIIRTQRDQIADADFRQPFPPYLATRPDGSPRPFGVWVSGVDDAPTPEIARLLQGAGLRLMRDPCFELRNQIVGDGINRIAPPIVPFDLQLERDGQVLARRSDPLDPRQPDLEIWQLAPQDFAPRVPVTYRHLSDEVVETIFPPAQYGTDANGIFNAYFNLRQQQLQQWLSEPRQDPLTQAGHQARLRMIETFSQGSESSPGLMVNRLGLQCIWDHGIRGDDAVLGEALAPYVDPSQPWHTRFWMGGWDGDLLLGWTSGRVDLPLRSA